MTDESYFKMKRASYLSNYKPDTFENYSVNLCIFFSKEHIPFNEVSPYSANMCDQWRYVNYMTKFALRLQKDSKYNKICAFLTYACIIGRNFDLVIKEIKLMLHHNHCFKVQRI